MLWNGRTIWIGFLLAALAALAAWQAPAAHALTDAEFSQIIAAPTPNGSGAAAGTPDKQNSNGALKTPSLAQMLVRLAAALGVVFGLMALILWGGRRFFPQSPLAGKGGAIEVVATRTLGQRRSLMLIRTQGKTMLIGATPQQINFITEFEPEADWADAAGKAAHKIGLDPNALSGTTGLERDI